MSRKCQVLWLLLKHMYAGDKNKNLQIHESVAYVKFLGVMNIASGSKWSKNGPYKYYFLLIRTLWFQP